MIRSIYKRPKNFTPMIIEESEMNASIISVFDRLMQDRIIFLGEPIDDFIANTINAQLLFLDSDNNDPIKLYINSPGGDVYSGLAIYDTIQMIKSPVHTYCMGLAASMASLLLMCGEKGHRYALPNSKVMIHQPLSGIDFSQATDIEIHNKELQSIKHDINNIIFKHSTQPLRKIKKDVERDFWMKAEDALAYGIIDEIKGKK